MYYSVMKPSNSIEKLEMFTWCTRVLGEWQKNNSEDITQGWSHRIGRISDYHVYLFLFPTEAKKFLFDMQFSHFKIYDSLNDYYNKVERAKFSPKQRRWTI